MTPSRTSWTGIATKNASQLNQVKGSINVMPSATAEAGIYTAKNIRARKPPLQGGTISAVSPRRFLTIAAGSHHRKTSTASPEDRHPASQSTPGATKIRIIRLMGAE